MSAKGKLVALSIAALISTATGAAALSAALPTGGPITVRDPEVSVRPAVAPPPLLAPPGNEAYTALRGTSSVSARDGRPVAQFAKPPSGFQLDAVSLPEPRPVAEGSVAYTILSSVRYTGNGHTVTVSTTRPSSAAAQRPNVLGNQTVRLADGSTVWTTTGALGGPPNRVVQVRGDLIISILGDPSVEQLKAMVPLIVVSN